MQIEYIHPLLIRRAQRCLNGLALRSVVCWFAVERVVADSGRRGDGVKVSADSKVQCTPFNLLWVAWIARVAFASVPLSIPGDWWWGRPTLLEVERLRGCAEQEREECGKAPDKVHVERKKMERKTTATKVVNFIGLLRR